MKYFKTFRNVTLELGGNQREITHFSIAHLHLYQKFNLMVERGSSAFTGIQLNFSDRHWPNGIKGVR